MKSTPDSVSARQKASQPSPFFHHNVSSPPPPSQLERDQEEYLAAYDPKSAEIWMLLHELNIWNTLEQPMTYSKAVSYGRGNVLYFSAWLYLSHSHRPVHILKRGGTKQISARSFTKVEGLVPPLCPHVENDYCLEEDCKMELY